MLKKMLIQGLVAAAIIGGGAAAYSAMAGNAHPPQASDSRTTERVEPQAPGNTGYLKPETRAKRGKHAAKKNHRCDDDDHDGRKRRHSYRKRFHDHDGD
jgi:hypothetical protein